MCLGTACYIKGADKLLAEAREAPAHQAGRDDAGRQYLADDGALRGRMRARAGGSEDGELVGPDAAASQLVEQLEGWAAA